MDTRLFVDWSICLIIWLWISAEGNECSSERVFCACSSRSVPCVARGRGPEFDPRHPRRPLHAPRPRLSSPLPADRSCPRGWRRGIPKSIAHGPTATSCALSAVAQSSKVSGTILFYLIATRTSRFEFTKFSFFFVFSNICNVIINKFIPRPA